ncbi:MAG: flavin reductase [Streptococcaceae bacterium]|nr:flavin reductase [Streptococcaceae bacterium]
MVKVDYPTEKFYPGYPVFIVMTKGENNEILTTTMSSSYTLRDTLVLGMSKDGNTAQHLEIGKKLSANFLHGEQGLFSDIGGMSRRIRQQKLSEAGAIIEEVYDVPTLRQAPLTLICKVMNRIEDDKYFHFFVTIEQRLIEEELLKDDKIDWTKFLPLEYMGDGKQRHYKTVSADYKNDGDYLREKTKFERKNKIDQRKI